MKYGGRKKGTQNKITKEVKESLSLFLNNNIDQMQVLFDRVAEDNPQKAIELLFKSFDYFVPKMKQVEVAESKQSIVVRIEDKPKRFTAEELREMSKLLDAEY